MRKDSRKQQQEVGIAGISGYHSHETYRVGYQYQGFSGNWYFNSDRKEKTEFVNGILMRVDKDGNHIPFAGYGLEIETECCGINNPTVLADVLDKIVFPCFKFGSSMFKMQEDASLGGDTSAEIITQVMTKSRIRNDYAAYKTMFDYYFPAFGISADSYRTSCGMHVNVSNAVFGDTEEEQAEAIRKLFYLVNRHYELFCRLFYRCPRMTRWCGQMEYINARSLDLSTMENDHRKCMNLSHFTEGRIEIRLVGGQKNYYCFRNTMETVFFLCEKVRSLKWEDLDDLTKVFKGCNRYVFRRIETECDGIMDHADIETIRRNVNMRDNFELER